MPVFADQILKAGPQGLGVLRAAPAAGAMAMSLYLAHRRPIRRAGRALLTSVAIFALCIIGFGLSRSFALSLALLAVSGMAVVNTALGLAMLISRYWLIIPTLAVAGSLARKKHTPPSAGTLPTHTPLFVTWLACTVVLVGALTFVPALALGPIVEHLQMAAK